MICRTFKCTEFFRKWTDRLTPILSLALCSRCYLSSETHSYICKFSHPPRSPSCSLLIEAVGHDIFWALRIQVRLLRWLCCLCLFDFLSGTRSIHLPSQSHKSTGKAQTAGLLLSQTVPGVVTAQKNHVTVELKGDAADFGNPTWLGEG